MVAGQSPDGIGALAKVLQALNLGSTVGYMWGFGATVAWKMERDGKRRIIRKKGELQKRVEGGDAYRSSSGLNHHGNDPGDDNA
jgi:hypothetical protein